MSAQCEEASPGKASGRGAALTRCLWERLCPGAPEPALWPGEGLWAAGSPEARGTPVTRGGFTRLCPLVPPSSLKARLWGWGEPQSSGRRSPTLKRRLAGLQGEPESPAADATHQSWHGDSRVAGTWGPGRPCSKLRPVPCGAACRGAAPHPTCRLSTPSSAGTLLRPDWRPASLSVLEHAS